jgi:hypothetical protein
MIVWQRYVKKDLEDWEEIVDSQCCDNGNVFFVPFIKSNAIWTVQTNEKYHRKGPTLVKNLKRGTHTVFNTPSMF